MSKKLTFRRFLAFIIDLLIVSFIVGAFSSLKVLNPTLDKYDEAYDNYYSYIEEAYANNDVNKIFNDQDALDMSYYVTYYGRYSSTIGFVVMVLYFGLFQFYTDGKTVGKLLFRIKVKSTKGKLKFSQVLIRSAIIDSLAIKLLTLLSIFLLSKSTYNSVGTFLEILDMGIILCSAIMIMYRQDGVGLHDMLAHTMVVKIDKESVKEAKYIEK